MNYSSASAKPENLAKVAATKDADGYVSLPARMQRASFAALVQYGWLSEVKVPCDARVTGRPYWVRHVVSPKGEEVLKGHAATAENPFIGGHGEKAQETFRLLGTKHSDWFHPAVKWVRETRNMPFETYKACPDCDGLKWVQYDSEGKVIPPPVATEYGLKGYSEAGRARETYMWAARKAAAGTGAWNGNCRKCMTHGRRGASCEGKVFDKVVWKPVEMMVGYVVWPKGVKHHTSRFGYNGNSTTQCEVCGKGINKSNRVPVAHDKDGKALSMMVGEDCAKKFIKVATLKPSKSENPKALTYVLDDNYEAEGEVK